MAMKRPFSIMQLQLPGDPVYNRTNIVNLLDALTEAVERQPRLDEAA